MSKSANIIASFLFCCIARIVIRKCRHELHDAIKTAVASGRAVLLAILHFTAVANKLLLLCGFKRRANSTAVIAHLRSQMHEAFCGASGSVSEAALCHTNAGVFHSATHGLGVVVLPSASATASSTGSIPRGSVILEESPFCLGSPESDANCFAAQMTQQQFSASAASEQQQLQQQQQQVMMALTLTPASEVDVVDDRKSLEPLLCESYHRNVMRFSNVDFSIRHDSEVYGEEHGGEEEEEGRTEQEFVAPPVGLFFIGSRFNHSCSPNALQVFEKSGSSSNKWILRIIALCDLREGEEILISYCNPLDTRLAKLRRMGFACRCDHICCSTADQMSPLEETRYDAASSLGVDAVAAAADAVDRVVVKAAETSSESAAAGGGAQRALRFLLGFHNTQHIQLLGKFHALRLRLQQETLSLAVFNVSNLDTLYCLLDMSQNLIEAATLLLPVDWPLRAAFCVHRAMLLAFRARLLLRQGGKEEKMEKPFDGEKAWDSVDSKGRAEAEHLVAVAKQSHAVVFDGRLSFEVRFETELSCLDFDE